MLAAANRSLTRRAAPIARSATRAEAAKVSWKTAQGPAAVSGVPGIAWRAAILAARTVARKATPALAVMTIILATSCKHESEPMGSPIWAPEIHYIDGRWYIYVAAGDSVDI